MALDAEWMNLGARAAARTKPTWPKVGGTIKDAGKLAGGYTTYAGQGIAAEARYMAKTKFGQKMGFYGASAADNPGLTAAELAKKNHWNNIALASVYAGAGATVTGVGVHYARGKSSGSRGLNSQNKSW